MLCELSIKNFAIIDDIKMRFSDGLTILSGETGAGKSLLIQAVNLLLGGRASSKLIRAGYDNAELEAFFDIEEDSYTAEIMRKNDYDDREGLLVRRIISRDERHKIYINNRLATISFLTLLTENLTSISAQHANQQLLKEDNHLLILDRFAGLNEDVKEVKTIFEDLEYAVSELNRLVLLKKSHAEHSDFLKFQLNEITSVNPLPDEDVALEQEITILKNGENLYKIFYESIEKLYAGEGSATEILTFVEKNMQTASAIDPTLCDRADKITDIKYRIEDIISELRDYLGKISTDEKRLEEAENRRYALSKLKQKYGGAIEEVLKKKKEIEKEIVSEEDIRDLIKDTENKVYRIYNRLSKISLDLSEKRKKAAVKLSRAVENELAFLKMANCRFETVLKPNMSMDKTESYFRIDENMLTETGLEKFYFNISANPGEPLKPLASIASGGELSRIILAIKAILARNEEVGTVIFDEVDAGIGGDVAELVGKKLSELSKFHRIVCITHLPQIAKFGDHHLKILKTVEKGRTTTEIMELSIEDRIEEIAKMLGGEKLTRVTMEHAKEMLKGAGK